MKFSPNLAHRDRPDLSKIQYPVYGLPKYDGIRISCLEEGAVSRSLKPIPNSRVRAFFENNSRAFVGLDGEFIVGPPNGPTVYTLSSTAFKKIDTSIDLDWKYYVFDLWNYPYAFDDRYAELCHRFRDAEAFMQRGIHRLELAPATLLHNEEEVLAYEQQQLDAGYEGTILRRAQSRYKMGRSTLAEKEQGMMKLKNFEDDEARVLDIEEAMHNDNEAFTNELGRTARSSHAANRTQGLGHAGAVVAETKDGVVFRIGIFPGMTLEDRKRMLENKKDYIDEMCVYSSFRIGVKEAPRHAKWKGLRHKEDMS